MAMTFKPVRGFIHRSSLFCSRNTSFSTKKLPIKPPKNVQPTQSVDTETPLPFLQRPLGVRDRPTTTVKTWTESRNELMNQDIRLEKRRHILKEVSKGYFSDLNATRKHGGKTWIAPNVMIRQQKALYFPDVAGKNVVTGETMHTTDMCAGHISVISILSTKISEYHIKGFVDATNLRFSRHPSYQFVQINLQENLLKSMLVSLFTASIRKTVPEYLWPTYLVSNQNMEYSREALGMVNNRVGYVYLVDDDLKIRWGGCADAKPEEAQALENCTAVLLNRTEKKLEQQAAMHRIVEPAKHNNDNN